MKVQSILILIFLCGIEARQYLRSVKVAGLRKVFKDLILIFEKVNEEIVMVVDQLSNHPVIDFVPATIAKDPHHVTSFSNTSQLSLNKSTIVLLGSVPQLESFNQMTTLSDTFLKSHQIYIYCEGAKKADIAKFITHGTYDKTQSVHFFIEEGNMIKLMLVDIFLHENCNDWIVKTLNVFSLKTWRWHNRRWKKDPIPNFHGCKIIFYVRNVWPVYEVIEKDKQNHVTKCAGFICHALKDLSSNLNFTYHVANFKFEEKTFFDPNEVLLFLRSMVSLAQDEKQAENESVPYVFTRPFMYKELFIAIPPGKEYNSYEKMVLPFDEATWMWISITFAATFFTIFMLRLAKPEVSSFVIGRETRTPALNVFRAFFGISQIVCPGRNFARYLLMMFILFSLIIRTAYQGKMFEFLQKEMRQPTVTTIEEMIEQDFVFYMPKYFEVDYPEVEIVKRGKIDRNTESKKIVLDRLYSAGFKIGMSYYKTRDYFRAITGLNKTEAPKLLPDRYMLQPEVMLFKRRHFLFQIFDIKIQQLQEHGLIDYYIGKGDDEFNLNKLKKDEQPFKVLTLEELQAGFVISTSPLILSFVVFCLEWMVTLLNLMTWQITFKAYFEMRKTEQNHQIALKKITWQVILNEKKMKMKRSTEIAQTYIYDDCDNL